MDVPAAGMAEMVRVTRKRGVVGGLGLGVRQRPEARVRVLWDAARELDPNVADESHLAGVHREGRISRSCSTLPDWWRSRRRLALDPNRALELRRMVVVQFTFGVGPAGSYVVRLRPAIPRLSFGKLSHEKLPPAPVVLTAHAWAAPVSRGAARFSGGTPEGRAAVIAQEPIGRMGTADEIASAVVWLCSDAAAFVVGHAMVVDGGQTT